VAGGYEPPSYPEFLQDEVTRQGELPWAHEPPAASDPLVAAPAPQDPQIPPPSADPGPPSPPRRTPGFDSEFFTDEPATETTHGADFLLDDDDESGGDYRGRRARRD
jgi:hypothetical protein